MFSLEQVFHDCKGGRSRRLNAVGHFPGCVCEICFVLLERAIRQYLPGLLPEEPVDPYVTELEKLNRQLRAELQHLRTGGACVQLTRRDGGGLDVDAR
ncbi:MAG: hypothetical protein ABIU05_16870 [Nitrospirales bacterium]